MSGSPLAATTGAEETFGITVTGNTLRGNNTLDDGSPEILLQYYVHDSSITGNSVTTTNAEYPLLVSRVRPAGDAAKERQPDARQQTRMPARSRRHRRSSSGTAAP